MDSKLKSLAIMRKMAIIIFCLCLFLITLLGKIFIDSEFGMKEVVLFLIYFTIFYLWYFYFSYPQYTSNKFNTLDYILSLSSTAFLISNFSHPSLQAISIILVLSLSIFSLCKYFSLIIFPKFARNDTLIGFIIGLNILIISVAYVWNTLNIFTST